MRNNDRAYRERDTVIISEYEPEGKVYTGRKLIATVGFVLDGIGFGVEKGTVVFSLKNVATVR